jgi:hypothetical protein
MRPSRKKDPARTVRSLQGTIASLWIYLIFFFFGAWYGALKGRRGPFVRITLLKLVGHMHAYKNSSLDMKVVAHIVLGKKLNKHHFRRKEFSN